jgi:hypothetical protein
VPALLDVVQVVHDTWPGRFRFLLSGSSARRLRRGGANLLPGRVHTQLPDAESISLAELHADRAQRPTHHIVTSRRRRSDRFGPLPWASIGWNTTASPGARAGTARKVRSNNPSFRVDVS